MKGSFKDNKKENKEYENAIDACILAEVSEYIALVDEQGNFIRINSNFTSLIANIPKPKSNNLWETLAVLTENKAYQSISSVFLDLEETSQWKKELYFNGKESFYGLCEVKKFNSEKIKSAAYLMIISDVSALTEAHQLIEVQANQDAVTGLANRHFFQSKIAHNINTFRPFSLLYIDLDNFKKVNDSLGHEYGDELLKVVSHRVQNTLLEHLTDKFFLARIGGDEFAIIMLSPLKKLLTESKKISKMICDKLQIPFVIKESTVNIGSSIGIAIFPDNATTNTGIMRCADLAMYESKFNGKNTYTVFDESLNEKINEQILLEKKIIKALDNEEFILHFQPQYQLEDNLLIGLEALIRWETADEIISPAKFIPFAEQYGLIDKIDRYVIKKSCQQIAAWKEQGMMPKKIHLSINISSQELNDASFFDNLNKEMIHYKVDSHEIEIEITEYSAVEHLENKMGSAHTILEALKRKGISVAIDDFGTGYSSLTYLKNMDIDRLKIDQSFVKDIAVNEDDLAIVEAIIVLGHRMGVKVIAEGIETPEQIEILKNLGCEEGQGYLLARPQNIEAITKMLTDLLPS